MMRFFIPTFNGKNKNIADIIITTAEKNSKQRNYIKQKPGYFPVQSCTVNFEFSQVYIYIV